MDIDVPGSMAEIPLTGSHLLVSELGLGLHTPYNPSKVVNLQNLGFDKATGKIV
jgi:hypothetical protein